jgi:hypothetical protein
MQMNPHSGVLPGLKVMVDRAERGQAGMMWNRARWWPPKRAADPTRRPGRSSELGFHARQGQARAGQTVLVLTGPDQTQTYLESTEAISPHGIALGSRQYGQAGV